MPSKVLLILRWRGQILSQLSALIYGKGILFILLWVKYKVYIPREEYLSQQFTQLNRRQFHFLKQNVNEGVLYINCVNYNSKCLTRCLVCGLYCPAKLCWVKISYYLLFCGPPIVYLNRNSLRNWLIVLQKRGKI